jgi:hypothetical protein
MIVKENVSMTYFSLVRKLEFEIEKLSLRKALCMSRRIAHRPRYRSTRQIISPPHSSHRTFFRERWSYRRRDLAYEKRPLGYGLLFVPFGYRVVQRMLVPQV